VTKKKVNLSCYVSTHAHEPMHRLANNKLAYGQHTYRNKDTCTGNKIIMLKRSSSVLATEKLQIQIELTNLCYKTCVFNTY
jgi:hypothetical protein